MTSYQTSISMGRYIDKAVLAVPFNGTVTASLFEKVRKFTVTYVMHVKHSVRDTIFLSILILCDVQVVVTLKLGSPGA